MKICRDHWAKLRAAVERCGMTHLVARDGAAAMQRTVLELEGRAQEAMFGPLMGAHNMIVTRALDYIAQSGGDPLVMFVAPEGGAAECPLCYILPTYPPIPVGHRYKTNESFWIDGPVDAMLEVAREKGLMPQAAP